MPVAFVFMIRATMRPTVHVEDFNTNEMMIEAPTVETQYFRENQDQDLVTCFNS